MKVRYERFLCYFLLVPIIVFSISSCSSYKKVPYLQAKDSKGEEVDFFSLYKENIVRFQPDDVLNITVNVVGEQSVAADYNLPLQPAATSDNSSDYVSQGVGRQSYMITKDGYIDFPVLGLIKVTGYTQAELENYLKKSLLQYLKVDPVVTVRLANFRVTVVGEVRAPGQYTISRDHVNILEVLALAGDMTIYGKRDEVKLFREMPNGDVRMINLDLSKADLISSPYFYLQQNDLVYIVPNTAQARTSDISSSTNIVFSVVSTLISLTSLIILISNQ